MGVADFGREGTPRERPRNMEQELLYEIICYYFPLSLSALRVDQSSRAFKMTELIKFLQAHNEIIVQAVN